MERHAGMAAALASIAACWLSNAVAAPPALYLADDALRCESAGWLTDITSKHREARDVALASKGKCVWEIPMAGARRTRIVALDAEELPFVFVCSALHYEAPEAGTKTGFMCGETLAKWIVDERGAQLSPSNLKASARTSTMADVRALP